MSTKVELFKTRRVALLALALIALVASLPASAAHAQVRTPVSYDFEECENVESFALREELNRITQAAFEREQRAIDLAALVDRHWRTLGLDAVVDSEVEAATQRVMDETGLLNRLYSGWSASKAQELTWQVADNAFSSQEVRRGFEGLSRAVSDDLVAEFQLVAVRSASSALLCVQAYIDDTISPTMAAVLDKEIQTGLDNLRPSTANEFTFLDIARNKPKLTSGVGIVVTSQVAKSLGPRLAQQVAGKVVARVLGRLGGALVPIAGWIVGAGLILWDLWSGRDGSFPRIREELQKEEVKREIRQQITLSMDNELSRQRPELARKLSNGVYMRWQEFRRKYARVLELGERNARFKAILDRTAVHEVKILTEFVAVVEGRFGAEELESLIAQGRFKRVLDLPEQALDMLRAGVEPADVIEWAELTDSRIARVVETGLYALASPSDFEDGGQVVRAVALSDTALLRRLMQLEYSGRSVLLSLSTRQARWILKELADGQLNWLPSYLEGLSLRSRNALLDFAMRDRRVIAKLHSSQALQTRFQPVAALAGERPEFRKILDSTSSDDIGALSSLFAIASDALEPDALHQLIDSGRFEEILSLPRPAFAILRDTSDPAVVLEWGALAGNALAQVVRKGIHLLAQPSDIATRDSLDRVLALDHQGAVERLFALQRKSRARLLTLPPDLAREFLISMPEDDLDLLANYVAALNLRDAALMAYFLLARPDILPILTDSPNLRSRLPRVLALSAKNPDLSATLDGIAVADVEKLANLTAIAAQNLSERELNAEIRSGRFKRVLALPQSAFDILVEKGDLGVVLDWAALAEENIEAVVETLLYRHASPSDFGSRDALNRTLALQDREAIGLLMQLDELQRVVLLSLSTETARSTLHAFSLEDLPWLALFIAKMEPGAKDPAMNFLNERPELLPELRRLSDLSARFPRLVLLALEIPSLETILNSTPPEQMDKLSALVASADASMSVDAIRAMIASQQFEAVLALRREAFAILRHTGDPAALLAWADLAGEGIGRVVDAGLYATSVRPGAFSGREEMDKVLDLGNSVAIQVVMRLSIEDRTSILRLPAKEAVEILVSDLQKEDLGWLAASLPGLDPQTRQLLTKAVAEKQGLVAELKRSDELAAGFTRLLETAGSTPKFLELLESINAAEVAQMTRLLLVAEDALSPENLLAMIESGQFALILSLPRQSFEILRETKDPGLVIRWAELAGDALPRVVSTGLYRIASPQEIRNRAELDALWTLENDAAVRSVLLLGPDERDAVLSLPPALATELVASLTPDELSLLAQTPLADWTLEERSVLAQHALQNPALLPELQENDVRKALAASRNKTPTLHFLAQRAGQELPLWPTAALLPDLVSATSGELPFSLFWRYHSSQLMSILSVLVLMVAAALAVLWLRRSKG